ncbi:hypothetical protein R1flu_013846 [Riccia fluitans]|uniref:Uncharacterized protein n=1 Tax=Riccia fluitans TaxID=41844 RepID=A0ABD1YER6_9MARC
MTPRSCKDLKLKTKEKVASPKNKYRGKPEAWTSDVWREVYNLPKASPGGYVMKGKVQFTELQLLKLVKGDKRQSKSGVFEQVEGNSDFILFCQILNSVLAPVRPEHFQHNQLAFYHDAWVAIMDPIAPTPNWRDAVKKTMTRQSEEPKKQKALEQSVSDSETETEEEKKMKGESPNATWIGEASGSKPLDTKTMVNFKEWGVLLQNLGRETSKLF